jgi:very-short-patch-repair endonuclease
VTSGAEFPFVAEYKFHPTRKWRIDWYCERLKLAIEVDGFGRHQTFMGFAEDAVKQNAICEMGIRLLRYTPQQISSDPHGVVSQILRVAESPVDSRE